MNRVLGGILFFGWIIVSAWIGIRWKLPMVPRYAMMVAGIIGLSVFDSYLSRRAPRKWLDQPALKERLFGICRGIGLDDLDPVVEAGSGVPTIEVTGSQLVVSPRLGELMTDSELAALLVRLNAERPRLSSAGGWLTLHRRCWRYCSAA